jgi:hypothetical protein
MNADQVQALVQAVESRPQPSVKLMPGTIAAMGTGVAEVVMDGDPDGTGLDASLLFSDVSSGDRVMVLFDPPQGVYVVGTIGRPTEAGTVVFFSGVEDEIIDDNTFDVSTGSVEFRAGRRYLLNVFGQCIKVGDDPAATLARFQPILAYIDNGTVTSMNPFTNVDGMSVPTTHGSVGESRLLVPTQTYVSPVQHSINVQTSEVRAWSTAVITDVGPA